MAQISITIPDGKLNRVVNAVCIANHYREFQSDGTTPNPETKAQFTRRMVVEQIKQWVAIADGIKADTDARAAVVNDATLVT